MTLMEIALFNNLIYFYITLYPSYFDLKSFLLSIALVEPWSL